MSPIDPGRKIDWSKTTEDYLRYRPGPPQSFYKKLLDWNVGSEGQKILDLGTGTGVLARQFSSQGAHAFGTDISELQIVAAKKAAQDNRLLTDFRVARAEEQPFENDSFDVICANQCWLYFDKRRVVPEVIRLLRSGGRLVTSHFSWLPFQDRVAHETEQLILKYNPQWTAGGFDGSVPEVPEWSKNSFTVEEKFVYTEAIDFSLDAWCGRIRASRGIGATLEADRVKDFDAELRNKISSFAGEQFRVLHAIDAHLFSVS